MRMGKAPLLASQTFYSLVKEPTTKWLLGLFIILLAIALFSSYSSHLTHYHTVDHYSDDVRDRWENSPDKHPHRMAHYGYVVFRQKYPLSFFDLGIDSYLGNVVFLEAHRQNTINFSQVSLSNGLLRFGELSAGLILQLLIPLLIFFLGFGLVAGERETGTLKVLLSQGVNWSEIVIGKSLGLFLIPLIILVITLLITFIFLVFHPSKHDVCDLILNFGTMTWSYVLYFFIISLLAVWISTNSRTQKSALIYLIGIWLFFILIIPKAAQVIGQVVHPTPSKIEFDTQVEHEIIKQGDSHNPDDPHYQAIKDSLLEANGVTSTNELPFNYSGYIMREGERLSTHTYRQFKEDLIEIYKNQNFVIALTAFINPHIAIKNISMAMSGTDFLSFRNFDTQAERYRYQLAQTMNELQIKHIGNTVTSSADKAAIISQQYWIDFPNFQFQFLPFSTRVKTIAISLIALLIWFVGLLNIACFYTKHLKAI